MRPIGLNIRVWTAVPTLAAGLILGGCVSLEERRAAFAQRMDTWVGRNADELITTQGPPTNSAALSNGGKVYEYSKNSIVTSGGGSYTVLTPIFVPNARGGGSFISVPEQRVMPMSSAELSCKLLFRISPTNRIESWSAQGNACY